MGVRPNELIAMNRLYVYTGGAVVLVAIVFGVMYIFRPTSSVSPVQNTPDFGQGSDVGGSSGGSTATNQPQTPVVVEQGAASSGNKVYQLLEGPVAGAVVLQMGRPTTTVARFVMADSGRVFDLPLDVPGAVPRVVSNTTVPGIARVVWTAGDSAPGVRGDGALMQYVDQDTIKTVHVAFPPATTTLSTTGAVKLKFLPDGVQSIAASPDGKSITYLLKAGSGSDGYTAKPDGTSSRKAFALPLMQMLVSWPSQATIMAQSPSAAGVPGVVYSINAQTGTTEPIIYAEGLSASANTAFSKVVYQSASAGARSTYVRDVRTGLNTGLSFDPMPERCVWNTATIIYCASPLTFVPANYLDLWHAGVSTAQDSLFAYDVASGATKIMAAPGSNDGGEAADIAEFSVARDGSYAIYIRKGDRSLWGVRLGQ